MEHVITTGDLFWPLLGIFGLAAVVTALLGLVWLFNPFRSGH